MKDGLLIGVALGFLAGAVLVQSNRDAQRLVQKGKDAINKKIQEVKLGSDN